MSLDSELIAGLNARRDLNQYRSRNCLSTAQQVVVKRGNREFLNFCSNDYLGLANHPKLKEALKHAVDQYGVGSGASHLMNGHSDHHHALEQELAAFTQRPRALLFSSGYMANLGVINALTNRGDGVFEDKLNHASLIDGGLLSRAEFSRFNHKDLAHLESRIKKAGFSRKLIVTDGVFSMDGDVANLPELVAVAKKYNSYVMVDDAHGFGCLGDGGRGTVNHFNLSVDDVPILVGTLGKAFGTFGAFVAGSETLIESLIQFSRTYIYTTAIPPAVAAATRESLKLIEQEDFRREQLKKNIAYFKSGCQALDLSLMKSDTPIQPILMSSESCALTYADKLSNEGIWITAIRPPTVPKGTSRLRVTLTAEHSSAHIDRLLTALAKIKSENCDDS